MSRHIDQQIGIFSRNSKFYEK